MEKSKKSKILAIALCASVMTGIYASPVMAGNVDAKFDSDSGNNVFTISGNTYTINKDDITKAIEKNHIHSNGQISANAGFIANGGSYYAIRGTNNQYTMLANEKYFALGSGGLLKGPEGSNNYNTTKEKATFYVDNATGNVRTKGDVTTLNDDGKVNYTLNTIGNNTQKITFNGKDTVVAGKLVANKFGTPNSSFYVEENGTLKSNKITVHKGEFTVDRNGAVKAANGAFTVDKFGNTVSKGDVTSTAADGTTTYTLNTIGANTAGIEHDPVAETTTIEGDFAVNGKDNTFGSKNGSFTVDAEDGTFTAAKGAFKVREGVGETVIAGSIISSKDILGNYGSLNGSQLTLRAINGESTFIDAGRVSIDNGSSGTIISGGTITTGTLEVENIKLGNSMTDKDGNTITIGAAGVIDIKKDGNTVFRADTDNFEAHYDNYELTLDGTNGFALSNETSSFTLKGDGFAFAGPVHLGNGTQVEFSHNGTDISLSSLVGRVEDLEQKTTGISFDENTGSTTIKDMNKVDGEWKEGDSSVTVGDNGTTFENGKDNGTTNINGSEIVSDATNVESGSGSGSGFGGGTSTTNGDNAVYVGEDGDYTHVSSDGVTIGDKTNTNTTNIDKDGMVVNGSNGTTHISDSGMTVTGENGTNNISDSGMTITGKDGNTTNNISDKGMTVTGSNGTTDISGGDISVDNSVTVAGGSENKTTINNEGITVGDKGTSIKNDSISVGDGGYIGDGDVRSGEGVSLNDTAERVGHLENRVGELEDRIDKVGAMAAAIANLRTMGYDPAAPTEVAVGIGQYRDETGAALGLFHYPNRDFMLSLSVSTSGDEVMGGIGATWKFGRKSPEKVAEIKKAQAEADARRAEEAKLAKAEEMKQAAKEAKIKAQQERHAKLAAERAAQAEAAK